MDAELIALFEANAVHAAIVEKFRKCKCTKISTFAYWFDNINSEVGPFLESVAEVKEDLSQKPCLKFCATKAVELTKAQIARSAQGMQDQPLDEPLPAEQHRSIINTAVVLYRWNGLDSRCYVCDSQLAKFRREFVAWQPSMVSLAKLRSLAMSQKNPTAKKLKMTGDISIQLGNAVEDAWNTMDIISWPENFALAVRSWAIAGCYDVPEQAESAKNIKMCEFFQADAYRFEFTCKIRELRERFSDASIIRGLSMCEEAFRAKAIDLCRSEQKIPWGLALWKSLNENVQIWSIMREALQHKSQGGFGGGGGGGSSQRNSSRQNSPAPRTKGGGPKGGGKGGKPKGGGKGKDGIKFATNASGQTPYCRKFNDKTCNSSDCRFLHVCNALLKSGQACGSKDHPRNKHNVAQHGAVVGR